MGALQMSGLAVVTPWPDAPAPTPIRFLSPEILVKGASLPDELRERARLWSPKSGIGQVVRDLLRSRNDISVDQAIELLEACSRTLVIESSIRGTIIHQDGARVRREVLGILSRKVITTVGVGFLVDAWQNAVELENMKYHAFGSGSTAEASGDTALVTEYTTQYASDNVRPTGSLTEGASANIFRSVGTFAPDATVTVQEHGLLSSATVGAGVLWDRSLTGGQALTGSVDSLQVTYDMTASAGG